MYAIADIRQAFANVRGWSYLARKRLQLENRGTWVGSAWILLTFGLTGTGIGVLMAQLQGRALGEHVPYVLFGFVAFNFMSHAMTGGANVMVSSKPYLLQMPTPRSVFVLSMVLRSFYLLVLQLITASAIAALLGWRPDFQALWAMPALAVYAIAAFSVAMTLGLLCARYRDLTRLIESGMRLAFFFTPIMWHADSTRGTADGLIGFIMLWNPFTYALQAFRDGLLGQPPDPINWIVLGSITLAFTITGFVALNGLGRRVTYWL